MFFDSSNEAMSNFVGAVVSDVATLLHEMGSLPTSSLDYPEFLQRYKQIMVDFSQRLTENTSLLKCDSPSSLCLVPRCHRDPASASVGVQTEFNSAFAEVPDTPRLLASPSSYLDSASDSTSLKSRSTKRCNRLAGPKKMLHFEQTAVLRSVYAQQTFLTPEQRVHLAKQLDITPQQIKIWFQNRRFKDKVKLKQQNMSK